MTERSSSPVLLAALASCSPFLARRARSATSGAFDPRILLAGGIARAAHASAPARWSYELAQRTSAPARTTPSTVRADEPAVTNAPFLYFSGDQAMSDLTAGEVTGLRRFFALGGVMVVDDAGAGNDGEPSAFGRTARRADSSASSPIRPPFRSVRSTSSSSRSISCTAPKGGCSVRRRSTRSSAAARAQVIFTSNDLGGALAGRPGLWEAPVIPGGDIQREHAIRLAVNIAMYVLCSNYKDDQVHAPFLMRKRSLAPVSPY